MGFAIIADYYLVFCKERLKLEIEDIQSLFGDKYDDGLYEVWQYVRNSGVY